jgi:hypothetical protein
LKKVFWEYQIDPLVDTGDELSVTLSGDIHLSFVYFPFVPIEPLVATESINLFGINDLLVNKAYAIGRRGVWRDYADIYWGLKNNNIVFDTLIALALRKFNGVFAKKLFLEQLVYFDDVGEKTVDWVGKSVDNEEIKRWIKNEVDKYLESNIL